MREKSSKFLPTQYRTFRTAKTGTVDLPYNEITFNSTNVAYMSKARIEHGLFFTDLPVGYDLYVFPKNKVPHILATSFKGLSIVQGDDPWSLDNFVGETYGPFCEKSTILYDGIKWLDKVTYYLLNQKFLWLCDLYIRRAGTITNQPVGGEKVQYDILELENDSQESGGMGGGWNEDVTITWDTYYYNKKDELIDSDSGVGWMPNFFYHSIEARKYNAIMQWLTGG